MPARLPELFPCGDAPKEFVNCSVIKFSRWPDLHRISSWIGQFAYCCAHDSIRVFLKKFGLGFDCLRVPFREIASLGWARSIIRTGSWCARASIVEVTMCDRRVPDPFCVIWGSSITVINSCFGVDKPGVNQWLAPSSWSLREFYGPQPRETMIGQTEHSPLFKVGVLLSITWIKLSPLHQRIMAGMTCDVERGLTVLIRESRRGWVRIMCGGGSWGPWNLVWAFLRGKRNFSYFGRNS